MISSKQEFNYNNVKFEANYSPEVKNCKVIRITIEGKSAEIDKGDLYGLLMLYADDKEMDKGLKLTTMKPITRMVKVKTKEAIKKGGEVVFPITQMVTEEQADEFEKINKDKMKSKEEAEKQLA